MRSPRAALVLVFLLLCPLLAVSCATLPDLDLLRAARPQQSVRIITAKGIVTTPTRQLVSRLQEAGQSDLLRRHLGLMESLRGPPLVAGNEAHVLIDGPATYRAMFGAMEAAKDHINLEVYIFRDDAVGQQLAEILLRKQAQGVQVNVIYDSLGSILTPREFFTRLSEGGINLLEFHPVNPINALKLNNRDHRKITIIDGKIGFTGGINFSEEYSSASSNAMRRPRKPSLEDGWRDTQIEIRGPAVAEFQRLFLDNWKKQNGPPLAPRNYFPSQQRQGNKLVRVIGSEPGDELNLIYIELLSAIRNAQKSIHITMAYFVPDRQTIDALRDAARRGVDVQLVLPGISDFWVVLEAGRSFYTELLKAGVKIHERRDAMLHAKTVVIDGVWSTIGSANMDMRSFLHNLEVNAVVLGDEFGAEMEAMFQADLKQARAIELKPWRARSPLQRIKEWAARVWEYWL